MPKASDISLVPLTSSALSSLENREDYVNVPGKTPEVGSKAMSDKTDVVYSGYFDCFDLSKEADRAAYAVLSARLFNGEEYARLWEERVVDGGSIKVFVNYIKYMNVNQSYIRPVNLKDIDNEQGR